MILGSVDLLEHLLSSERHPLVHGQLAVLPGVVLLEESVVLALLNTNVSQSQNKDQLTSAGQGRYSLRGVARNSFIMAGNSECLMMPSLSVSWSVKISSMYQ